MVEPGVGGRIFERTRAGEELPWGEVLAWDPPTTVRWLWHLGFTRSEATEVEVTFAASDGGTTVRLVQTGWDRLGEAGAARRSRTITGWTEVTNAYRRQLDPTDDDTGGT